MALAQTASSSDARTMQPDDADAQPTASSAALGDVLAPVNASSGQGQASPPAKATPVVAGATTPDASAAAANAAEANAAATSATQSTGTSSISNVGLDTAADAGTGLGALARPGTRTPAAAAALAAGGAGAIPAPVFFVTPQLSVKETFTDNARLTPTQQSSDWITELSVGGSAALHTNRSQFSADYTATQDLYLKNTNLNGLTQNLLAAGHTEPVQGHFTIDTRASLAQSPISQLGVLPATDRTTPNNQTQVLNIGLTPQYTQRFGDWGVGTLSYSINRIEYLEPSVGTNTGAPNSGTTHDISASLRNGQAFSRLLWGLTAEDTYSQSTGSQFSDRSLSANSELRINRQIGIPVTVGYDRYTGGESTFDAAGLSGVYWTSGVHLTPGPRMDFEVTYGRRYDGADWNGNFKYAITPQITFTATYETTVETQQQALAASLNSIGLNSAGQFVAPAGGSLANGNAPNFASQQQQPFVERQFQFGVTGTHGRNTLSFSGGTTDQSFRGGGADQSSQNIDISFTHQISPRCSLTLSVDPTRASIDGQGTSTTLQALAGVSYQLSEKASANFQIIHQRQNGTLDVQENVVFIAISRKL